MLRIDTHHHLIPPDYRKALQRAGIDEAGGRALPEWSPEGSLQAMVDLDVGAAILSASTPATTFLPDPADAKALARDLNDYTVLSSSAAAVPSLLTFAQPGHVTFGPDWPFAPIEAGKLFAELEAYAGLDGSTRAAIERTNAVALFRGFAR